MVKNEVMRACREFLAQANFRIWSFGDKRALRTGARDFVDLVAASKQGKIIFLEVKTEATNDKLGDGQKETAEILAAVGKKNDKVYYRIVNENNYKDIILDILED